jgi:hypothetical protein
MTELLIISLCSLWLGVIVQKVHIPIFLPGFICRICVWPLLRYRKLRYGYAFRKIPLTHGKYAIVDPEDYKELAKYKWYARGCGRRFYAERWDISGDKGKCVKMHQVIMGTKEGKVIDHINHNCLDNRKANLRFVTVQQNTWNKRKNRGNSSSQYKGVNLAKGRKKWRAQIFCNGRKIHLGYFYDEKEAAKAYDSKAKELFGEYATTNLP